MSLEIPRKCPTTLLGNVPRTSKLTQIAIFSAESRQYLTIRPVHRKQQENFDRMLKCITHLIYLLVTTAKSEKEKQMVSEAVTELVQSNIRSACTNDTLLHLSVSRLNVIKSGYFSDDNNLTVSSFF